MGACGDPPEQAPGLVGLSGLQQQARSPIERAHGRVFAFPARHLLVGRDGRERRRGFAEHVVGEGEVPGGVVGEAAPGETGGDPGDNRDYYGIQVETGGAVFDTHWDDYMTASSNLRYQTFCVTIERFENGASNS
jgi:hypothetical protein